MPSLPQKLLEEIAKPCRVAPLGPSVIKSVQMRRVELSFHHGENETFCNHYPEQAQSRIVMDAAVDPFDTVALLPMASNLAASELCVTTLGQCLSLTSSSFSGLALGLASS